MVGFSRGVLEGRVYLVVSEKFGLVLLVIFVDVLKSLVLGFVLYGSETGVDGVLTSENFVVFSIVFVNFGVDSVLLFIGSVESGVGMLFRDGAE